MLPPPTISTLFPYTTLFRSREQIDALAQPRLRRHAPRATEMHERLTVVALADQKLGDVRFYLCACRQDRKSTRLNSSHMSISYAVFCLKKKKKKKNQ